MTIAHSEKQGAATTFKKGYGFHPLCAFVDHGADGSGEPVAMMLRPGNAGANTAADHIAVLGQALRQLPWRPRYRVGRKVLVHTDASGGTHEFTAYCHRRRVQYGFGLSETIVAAIDVHLPKRAWTPAYDADGHARPGAWVAEITGLIDLVTHVDIAVFQPSYLGAGTSDRHSSRRSLWSPPDGGWWPSAGRAP